MGRSPSDHVYPSFSLALSKELNRQKPRKRRATTHRRTGSVPAAEWGMVTFDHRYREAPRLPVEGGTPTAELVRLASDEPPPNGTAQPECNLPTDTKFLVLRDSKGGDLRVKESLLRNLRNAIAKFCWLSRK